MTYHELSNKVNIICMNISWLSWNYFEIYKYYIEMINLSIIWCYKKIFKLISIGILLTHSNVWFELKLNLVNFSKLSLLKREWVWSMLEMDSI